MVAPVIAALADPRQNAKASYPLSEILRLVLSATLAGVDDFVEVTLWGAEQVAVSATLRQLQNRHPEPRHPVRSIRRAGPGVV
jgi:hypothetical protein